jgi:hypothetical protein
MSMINDFDLSAGNQVKVQIELPNGTVYDLTGLVVSLDLSVDASMQKFSSYGDPVFFRSANQETSLNIEIRGNGPITRSSHERKIREIRQMVHAREWQCPYCGTINPIEARNCGSLDEHAIGCGAVRPFIYG